MHHESLLDQRTSIRDARAEDAAAIARVAERAWRATYADLFPRDFIELALEKTYSDASLRAAIAAASGSGEVHFLVAERDGEVVAYLHFEREHDRAELGRIYVDPGLTRAGIGAALMDELHRRLAPGDKYVVLVHPRNEGALRFYARYGAEEVGRIDGRSHFLARYGEQHAGGGGEGGCDRLLEITVGRPA